jgi:hypothetical protein
LGGAPATTTSPPLKEGPAGPKPRDLGTGALLASASLAISYVAIGITSIAAARIVGANDTGVVALSNQIVLITVFVAGIGLRTSVAAMVGAGQWSVRGAVHRIVPAAFALGLVGGIGGYLYLLLQDSALRGFSHSMAIALMICLPFALLWWMIAAVAVGRER